MSSTSFGDDTGYSALAPYRDYLSLTEVSVDDVEFLSGLPSPLMISEENNQISQYQKVQEYSYQLDKTIYGLVSKHPQLQDYTKFINTYRLQNFLNGIEASSQITAFIPLNNINILYKALTTLLNVEDLIKYSIVPYVILPEELKESKWRIETSLRTQYIVTEGMSIVDEMTDYWPNKILGSYVAQNGIIYVIERPLIPLIY